MTIKKEGDKYVLRAKSSGKVLGKHSSRQSAEAQERAIQASKHSKHNKKKKKGGK